MNADISELNMFVIHTRPNQKLRGAIIILRVVSRFRGQNKNWNAGKIGRLFFADRSYTNTPQYPQKREVPGAVQAPKDLGRMVHMLWENGIRPHARLGSFAGLLEATVVSSLNGGPAGSNVMNRLTRCGRRSAASQAN